MAKRLSLKILFGALGVLLCTVPVIVCILTYFPIWIAEGGEEMLSGIALFLIIIALLPLYKTVRRLLASPSGYMIWLILFILFFALSKIAEEMTVICFVGFVSNALGAVSFKLSRIFGERVDRV